MTSDRLPWKVTEAIGWIMVAIGIIVLMFGGPSDLLVSGLLTLVGTGLLYACDFSDYDRPLHWARTPFEFVLRFVMAALGTLILSPLKAIHTVSEVVLSRTTP